MRISTPGRSGAPGVLKKLQTRGKLNNGTTLAYAWGLQIGGYRGLPIVEHRGSLGGYRAHLFAYSRAAHVGRAAVQRSAIAPIGPRARRGRRRAQGSVHRAGAAAEGGVAGGQRPRTAPD